MKLFLLVKIIIMAIWKPLHLFQFFLFFSQFYGRRQGYSVQWFHFFGGAPWGEASREIRRWITTILYDASPRCGENSPWSGPSFVGRVVLTWIRDFCKLVLVVPDARYAGTVEISKKLFNVFRFFTPGCIFLGQQFSVERMVLKGFTLCGSCSMVRDVTGGWNKVVGGYFHNIILFLSLNLLFRFLYHCFDFPA